jgi:hypothetical protein
MKTTRLILVLAAALSLGLAVFANVRTHGSVTASIQSTINSDVSLFDGDSAADGIKVAATGQAPEGIQLAGAGGVFTGQAIEGIEVSGVRCAVLGHALEGIQVADDLVDC